MKGEKTKGCKVKDVVGNKIRQMVVKKRSEEETKSQENHMM